MQKLKRNYTSIHFYTRPRTRGCKILVLPKYGNQKDLKFSRIWRALGPEKHYICKALIAWLRPCNIPPSPPPLPFTLPHPKQKRAKNKNQKEFVDNAEPSVQMVGPVLRRSLIWPNFSYQKPNFRSTWFAPIKFSWVPTNHFVLSATECEAL